MIPEIDHSIYISHAWGGTSEEVVREIYTRCRKHGLNVIMDHQDLGYRESITSFMKNLGQADAIILVVSNKYLHSEYCMYELLQIYENKNMIQRIFPVVLDEVSIAKSAERLELVRYWENETENLEAKIRELKNLSYIEGITDDLNLYQKIRNNIANLTRILKDINTLNIRLHKENDYNDLILGIERYLEKTQMKSEAETHSSVEGEKVQHFRTTVQPAESKISSSKQWWKKIFRIFPFVIIFLLISGGAYRWLMQNERGEGSSEGFSTPQNAIPAQSSMVELSALHPDQQDPGHDSDIQSTRPQTSSEQSMQVSETKERITSQSAVPPKTKLDKLTENDRRKTISDPIVPNPVHTSESRGDNGRNGLNKINDAVENTALDKKEGLSEIGKQGSEAETTPIEGTETRIEKVYVPATLFSVRFLQDISSNHVEKGDLVYLTADKPIWSEEQMITKRNARVRVRVIDVKASHQGSRGVLGIRLEAIETMDGQWLELNYHDILEKRRGEIVFSKGTVLENVKLESTTIDMKILK